MESSGYIIFWGSLVTSTDKSRCLDKSSFWHMQKNVLFKHGVHGFAPGPFMIIPYPETQHSIHIYHGVR